jgi:hypothetical protein
MAWIWNANLHTHGDSATFHLADGREVVVHHRGDHIELAGDPPEIPDEIVEKAVIARGHGHSPGVDHRVGIGHAMRRALEAVYQDLIQLHLNR